MPGAADEHLHLLEADGEPRAALFLADGASIADPFFPTLHLLELLALHVAATRSSARPRSLRGRSALRRLVPRLGAG